MENREAEKEVKLRFTEEQHRALLRMSKETGNTITSIVRTFVVDGLKREAQKGAALDTRDSISTPARLRKVPRDPPGSG